MTAPASSVVVLCGLPASGKTSAAGRLRERAGARLIRSCDVFQDLGIDLPAWVTRTRRFTTGVAAYLRLRDAAYDEMARRLEGELGAGTPLVAVDAVHGEADKRRRVFEICARHGAAVVVLWCRCDDLDETRRRFAARAGREAEPECEANDLSVFRHIAALWQDPAVEEAPGLALVTYDTLDAKLALLDGPRPPAVAVVWAALVP